MAIEEKEKGREDDKSTLMPVLLRWESGEYTTEEEKEIERL